MTIKVGLGIEPSAPHHPPPTPNRHPPPPTYTIPLAYIHHPPRIQLDYSAIDAAAEMQKWDVVRLLLERKARADIMCNVRLILACLPPDANTNVEPSPSP